MFDGFEMSTIAVAGGSLRVRRGGVGPPVLLLHGHPQTHVMWHAVAPVLAERHTVICADLTGYGGSSAPATTADHEPYSKRAMGHVQIELMRELGFDRFAVVGHDRGGRVAYRMALDHPEVVQRLAVLDIVPTGEMWRHAGMEFGLAYWHWYFLAQPYDLPERIITADPEAFYGSRWNAASFHPDAVADYRQSIAAPGTVHAICEDYRAAAGIDREQDEIDRRAERRIQCPVLVLWGREDGRLEQWFDVLDVWRRWAHDVQGRGLPCGHHLAEELPEETATELTAFLQSSAT
ncbi:MAG: alpha/beta fold hydrolase [Nitriliruptorales bacterium]|nr:alpha/beta fold hydrolase [Nitriliruptorales bacterium]